MAILRNSEIKKMDKKQLAEKLKELKFELTKGTVTANRTNAKTKELKRTIARIHTRTKSMEGNKE